MSLDRSAVDDLLASVSLSGLIGRVTGTRLRGKRPMRGRCPFCGSTSREPLWVRDDWGQFGCHACGVGGDAISFYREWEGLDFAGAVEALGARVSELIDARPGNGAIARAHAEDSARQRESEVERKASRDRERMRALWLGSTMLPDTPASAYLRWRGIPADVWPRDLRFHPAVPYWGYADTHADEKSHLGDLPCMLAVIRDVDGQGIGLHRTYLTPDGRGKLSPPGDKLRNARKMVMGRAGTGHIDLRQDVAAPWPDRVLLAEGIESALSAWILGDRDGAPVAGISMGNIGGGSLGRRQHPRKPRATIPDGRPDLDRPGVRLPPAIRRVVLCGDGDSDPATTKAHLDLAAIRFGLEGREAFLAMAPDGQDWNDVLAEHGVAA